MSDGVHAAHSDATTVYLTIHSQEKDARNDKETNGKKRNMN